jgi:hypothetical protein
MSIWNAFSFNKVRQAGRKQFSRQAGRKQFSRQAGRKQFSRQAGRKQFSRQAGRKQFSRQVLDFFRLSAGPLFSLKKLNFWAGIELACS